MPPEFRKFDQILPQIIGSLLETNIPQGKHSRQIMAKFSKAFIVLLSLVWLAGCMTAIPGSDTVNPPMVERPSARVGNALGIHSSSRGNIEGIQATVSEGTGPNAVRVAIHNGPMAGVVIMCDRAGGGSVMVNCRTTNADHALVVREMRSVNAYAGMFSVTEYGPTVESAEIALHGPANGGGSETVTMPTAGTANYRGNFQSGAASGAQGSRRQGLASGDIVLTADFDAASVGAVLNGAILDQDGEYVGIYATFDGLQIDAADPLFYDAANTTMTWQGDEAWGEVEGGFYGPDAAEAAGAFAFGNDMGGMTGIFIGCNTAVHQMNCIAPAPRF
jgi:hypothetical protein